MCSESVCRCAANAAIWAPESWEGHWPRPSGAEVTVSGQMAQEGSRPRAGWVEKLQKCASGVYRARCSPRRRRRATPGCSQETLSRSQDPDGHREWAWGVINAGCRGWREGQEGQPTGPGDGGGTVASRAGWPGGPRGPSPADTQHGAGHPRAPAAPAQCHSP